MAEKVAKLGVNREKDFMYYVKDGAVWKVQRKQPGVPKGRPEKVADGGFEMDTNYIYFVDRDGDVAARQARHRRAEAEENRPRAKRERRQEGGQEGRQEGGGQEEERRQGQEGARQEEGGQEKRTPLVPRTGPPYHRPHRSPMRPLLFW